MNNETNKHGGVCDLPNFERNNYFFGKLMTVRDFFAEQHYFNEKRWLINRMINGWGVVCGLNVCLKENTTDTIIITPGLAIDCLGREILICEPQEVSLNDVVPPFEPSSENINTNNLAICLEYFDCKTEPVNIPPIDCSKRERGEFNRIRDSFKIRVKYSSEVKIAEPYGKYCPLTYNKEIANSEDYKSIYSYLYETTHQYLCRNLNQGCPEYDELPCLVLATVTFIPEMTDFAVAGTNATISFGESASAMDGEYNGFTITITEGTGDGQRRTIIGYDGDLRLAKINKDWDVTPDTSSKYEIRVKVDPCSQRKLVYNNALLFDLFNCYHGNLPHIIGISWSDYHAVGNVSWEDFKTISNNGLTVYFDQPMLAETINMRTFHFAVLIQDQDTGYRIMKYIPAENIEYKEAGNEYKATFYPHTRWKKDEFEGYSKIGKVGADFEIILKGNLILSKEKRALDGAFINSTFPTGNGVQGGDFRSGFSVTPAE